MAACLIWFGALWQERGRAPRLESTEAHAQLTSAGRGRVSCREPKAFHFYQHWSHIASVSKSAVTSSRSSRLASCELPPIVSTMIKKISHTHTHTHTHCFVRCAGVFLYGAVQDQLWCADESYTRVVSCGCLVGGDITVSGVCDNVLAGFLSMSGSRLCQDIHIQIVWACGLLWALCATAPIAKAWAPQPRRVDSTKNDI